MASPSLKNVGFELAYLTLLTKAGLKPLSRWEKDFSQETVDVLQAHGLNTRVVERSVASGKRLRELLFSATDQCLDFYTSRFDRTSISPSRANMRIEGRLFGYPSCCVESFAAKGYGRNSLSRSDQRILFHWACPQCAITPLLLPHYRRVYRECRLAMRGRMFSSLPALRDRHLAAQLKQAVAVAASLVALGTGLTPGMASQSGTEPDRHWIALAAWDDPDLDLLATWEETILGGQGRVDPRQLQAVLTGQGDGHHLHVTPDSDDDLLTDQEELDLSSDPQNPDENGNQILDGPELAQAAAKEIAGLPTKPSSDLVYRLDFLLRGLERCDICGTNVNMGHLTICNPIAQLYAKTPYIALHYFEHGSFSYAGNVHGQDRDDVKLLVDALHSIGPSHLRPLPGDTDQDGLTDLEERCLGTDLTLPDTDNDGVPDGFHLAHSTWEAVQDLPRTPTATSYVVEHLLRGLVTCDVCAEQVNMGYLEVINPRENITVELPYLALHAMRHGTFAYTPQTRVNPALLDLALRGDGTSHLISLPGDTDQDGLLDGEEPYFGMRPDLPDTNGDGVWDGVALARKMHGQILALPASVMPGKTYLIHHEADCFAPCPVCLETFNCGFVRVTNSWAELSLDISYMNLHFMEHGGFAVSPAERTDPVLLDAILRPAVLIVAQDRQVTLRWLGKTGRTYQVCTAPDVSGPWTDGPIFLGNDAEIVFTEDCPPGTERRFYRVEAR
jgi:hypothetical protein